MSGPMQMAAMLRAFDDESMRRARAENEVDRLNVENERLRREIAQHDERRTDRAV